MKSKKLSLSQYFEPVSPLVFGCMGLGGGWNNNPIGKEDIAQVHQAVDVAVEAGIKVFDHADIYTFGKAELVFAEVLRQRPELREQITMQSKCGIRFEEAVAGRNTPKRYDFSEQWINKSVEGILTRLGIEQLDILMLHRPDPLMEPSEVAETFASLQAQGKVKHFGVSNMNAAQMNLLQTELSTPLVVNQIEVSLSHLAWLEDGVTAGCSGFSPTNFATGTVEYCRQNKVQIQSWGSLSQGIFSGRNVSEQPKHIQNTAKLVAEFAAEYQVSPEAIVLAWLMRHPANIQPVIGTTNPERIRACVQTEKIMLTREHWYELFVSARGEELP